MQSHKIKAKVIGNTNKKKRIPNYVFDNHKNCGRMQIEREKRLICLIKLYTKNQYNFLVNMQHMHIFYIDIYQENESFNNIVANKTHKNKYFSRSVAYDFRVANSVCVKNDGESSILNV